MELSAFRRRARRLVDTVSHLIKHGPQTYAAFQARVDADRSARDNAWDHFVDMCLRQVLARDPPLYNAADIQAQFAAGTVPFGVHLLNRLLRRLQDDLGQLEDAQRGPQPMRPVAGWQGHAAPGAHLLPMPPPPGLMPVPFPPFGAHHHHQHHHLFHHPLGFPMVQHHFPHHHVHLAAMPQFHIHHQHHHAHQHVAQQHPRQQPQPVFAPPPQHAVPASPAAPVGVLTAGALHAHAAPAPPLARAVPGPGVQQVPPAKVLPAMPYGGAQHVSHGPAHQPQPSTSGGTTPVAATGAPPTGPPPTVPTTEPAAAHPTPRAPPAPEPRAESTTPKEALPAPVAPGGPVPGSLAPTHGV